VAIPNDGPGTSFRRARKQDVPQIIGLLADDVLGAQREELTEPLPDRYYDAFEAIDSDPNQELIVADASGAIVGVFQLTFLPSLTHGGSWRAQIEGVRVHSSRRGTGAGTQMLRWAIARARERGCRFVQLTTDKRRPDALRFYEALGFRPTHEGLKLDLEQHPG
jgi:GNAT superfamily N-acetyltransferase